MEKNEKTLASGDDTPVQGPEKQPVTPKTDAKPVEIGGPQGPEPTRYGDWERNGRVSDF